MGIMETMMETFYKVRKKSARRGSLNILTSCWGFPKIRGTSLGVPIIMTIISWCLYWGPPILGNYLLGRATFTFAAALASLRVQARFFSSGLGV